MKQGAVVWAAMMPARYKKKKKKEIACTKAKEQHQNVSDIKMSSIS